MSPLESGSSVLKALNLVSNVNFRDGSFGSYQLIISVNHLLAISDLGTGRMGGENGKGEVTWES